MSTSFRQDMPPVGGYPRVKVARTPVKTPLSNVALLAVAAGTVIYGLGRYIVLTREENKIRLARADEREQFLPVAQAAINQRALAERAQIEKLIEKDMAKLN